MSTPTTTLSFEELVMEMHSWREAALAEKKNERREWGDKRKKRERASRKEIQKMNLEMRDERREMRRTRQKDRY